MTNNMPTPGANSHRRFPPAPGRPELVDIGFERWESAISRLSDGQLAEKLRALSAQSGPAELLDAVFGNSPFLTQCLLRDPSIMSIYTDNGPERAIDQTLGEVSDISNVGETLAAFNKRLRTARRQVAATAALADLAGNWGLEQVTGALSDLASRAVDTAMRFHFRNLALRDLEDGAQIPDMSGLFVLGMGKLGAHELNYSSDIDLIVLYEPESVPVFSPENMQEKLVRVTRNMVASLNDLTEDGYVFRVDLRLRPDPGSTPVAISVRAAETYYEAMGQNWERAAMIKARPVAGDLEVGHQFLEILRPFIWRRSLDFYAIQDVHSIKRQIHAHKGGGAIAVAGHNIKLGRGGIREVEFFAQTQQLIFGGREPALRAAGTCAALHALAGAGRIDLAAAEELEASYHYLRDIEHRLQMVNDQQTQIVPDQPEELAAFARFAGHDSLAAFEATLIGHLRTVEKHYEALFEDSPDLTSDGNLAFTGADHDPETLATLTRLGFADPETVSTRIRAWHHGRYRATRSARSREILTELVPAIVEALGQTADPDRAFARFDEFIEGLPTGVQLFAMLHAHPVLLRLLAEIMGIAPQLADQLSRRPALFEYVLDSDFAASMPPREGLHAEIAELVRPAEFFEDALDTVRRWTGDRWFQIGVQLLRGNVTATRAGTCYSDVADTAIDVLLPLVAGEFEKAHGRVANSRFGIIAVGKLGAKELTATSDLDLVFIYDAPADAKQSDGERPLSVSHYFARFAQRLFNALTSATSEGPLFDVDMRLRPFGEHGPLASSLESLAGYISDNAWTWEKMALTRAHYVAGPPDLGRDIQALIDNMHQVSRQAPKLAAKVTRMWRRIHAAHPAIGVWQIKHAPGGIVDLEFLVQYLELLHAKAHPEIVNASTATAASALAKAGLIDDTELAELTRAATLYQQVQSILRLSTGGTFDPATASAGLRDALTRSTKTDSIEALEAALTDCTSTVAAYFEAKVGDIADLSN
jgi:glutamate-ammonia-ligase adenylyltransferase